MGNTPIVTIDSAGARKPTFQECLDYFVASYRAIYGNDVVFEAEDRDSQFLSLLAAALDDANAETIAAYNSFRALFAQGAGLSSLVKINGITRKVPSYSTVDLLVSGVVGTVIENGIAQDADGQQWLLPALVEIPDAGQLIVTATASKLGAVRASAGAVSKIFTVVKGWQAVTNLSAAAPGAPVETDALLRQRQASAASLPASTTLQGLLAAIGALPGVVRYRAYENNGPALDRNYGIPGRSIALVVEGGDSFLVANTLRLKKGNGVGTFGTTKYLLPVDENGIQQTVNFSRPAAVPITVYMRVKPVSAFTVDVVNAIKKAVSEYLAALPIGAFVELSSIYSVARLTGDAQESSFRIVPASLVIARDGGAMKAQDVPLEYNEAVVCTTSYVVVKVDT